MNSGARRALIPLPYRDTTSWPMPDISVWPRRMQNAFLVRKNAIEMYAAGYSWAEITTRTGKGRGEVRRLIRRCVVLAEDGAIWGYCALKQGVRVANYRRVKEVNRSRGCGSAGAAGALTQLFERFPRVEELVLDLYFKENARGQMLESRESYRGIHDKFKAALREVHLTDYDWPFNTLNEGYKSLYEYLRKVALYDSQRAVGPRQGVEAARRSSVGAGIERLLPSLRPYGAVQLDYHKVDAACAFIVKNDHGEEFEVPLARWHFGLVVEERSAGVIGYCIALELTPSSDSALEAVASALSCGIQQAGQLAADGRCILIGQLLPDMAGQCFSVLKVDNGWANAANEVVNNIIGTVGCAINFGPAYAWARRHLIERIFKGLTNRGMQRLPCTYGSGPSDTKRNDPHGQAIKFRIEISDLKTTFENCITEHNIQISEGRQWTSPVRVIETALANPASGLFPQPLPRSVQVYPSMMMHTEEVTVKGSIKKNIRPYFNLDRHKHTNQLLANSFWLVGKTLVVSIDRRLARLVYATVKETGEQLGQMFLSGPFAGSDCSWRDRKLLNRSGMVKRYGAIRTDPLEQVRQSATENLQRLKKSQRKKASKSALDIVRITHQQSRASQLAPSPEVDVPKANAKAASTTPGPGSDPFGLRNIPTID